MSDKPHYLYYEMLPTDVILDTSWLEANIGEQNKDWFLTFYSSAQIVYFVTSSSMLAFKLKYANDTYR